MGRERQVRPPSRVTATRVPRAAPLTTRSCCQTAAWWRGSPGSTARSGSTAEPRDRSGTEQSEAKGLPELTRTGPDKTEGGGLGGPPTAQEVATKAAQQRSRLIRDTGSHDRLGGGTPGVQMPR